MIYPKDYVYDKKQDINWNVLNMITRTNESKTSTKRIPWKYICEFDDRKCNSNQKWNSYKYWCECKNPKEHNSFGKDIWNPATCSCKNDEYIRSVITQIIMMKNYDNQI